MKDRYTDFIHHIFNHEVRSPEWYFDMDAERFKASDSELISYFTKMFNESGTVLLEFSDKQVNQGLWYVFGVGSDYSFRMRDGKASNEEKLDLIQSISGLYSGVFSERCSPVLSHMDQAGAKPVNSICYMLWDITALTYLNKNPEKDKFYRKLLSVMENSLYMENLACVESGLHGLGHLHYYRKGEVEKIIPRFIEKRGDLPEELIQYARSAQRGCVQ